MIGEAESKPRATPAQGRTACILGYFLSFDASLPMIRPSGFVKMSLPPKQRVADFHGIPGGASAGIVHRGDKADPPLA